METIKKAVALIGDQRKLARTIGVSKNLVYNWVHNKAFPSTRSAIKIEEVTKGSVTTEEILMEKANIKINEISNKIRGKE